MEFRRAEPTDLPEVMKIVTDAIHLLGSQGSPQWQAGYGPDEEKIRTDILNHELYVLVEEEILGMIALVQGIDPVYTAIKNGSWLGNDTYVSLHRVAVAIDVSGKGIAKKLLHYSIEESIKHGLTDIRIDTHELNIGMQKAILASGFEFRGELYFPIPHGKTQAYQFIAK